MKVFLPAVGALLWREVVRFLRQPNRIVGALGTPLVFWALIGSGVGSTFRLPSPGVFFGPDLTFLQYFYPGTIVLTLLFTAIFSTISIIEDRREGFLQGVLVAPIPRSSVVLGKILGGTLLAFGQGLLFLLLAPWLGVSASPGDLLVIVLVLFFLSFGLTGLGFLLAWRMDSTQGFHAVMNLFLMPLWFLSGALFPASGASGWMRVLMRLNPLSYGLAALHRGFYGRRLPAFASLPSGWVCLLVTVAFAAVVYVLALRTAERS